MEGAPVVQILVPDAQMHVLAAHGGLWEFERAPGVRIVHTMLFDTACEMQILLLLLLFELAAGSCT